MAGIDQQSLLMVICAQGQPPPHSDWGLFVSGLLFSHLTPCTTGPAADDGTDPYSRPGGAALSLQAHVAELPAHTGTRLGAVSY